MLNIQRKGIWIMVLGLMMAGCGQAPEEAEKATEVTPEEVKEEFKEAVETTGDYASQKTEEWRANVEAELAALQERLDKVESDLVASGTDAMNRMKGALEDLKQRMKSARENLEPMKESGKEAWDEFREGVENSIEELRRGMEQTSESS